MPQYLHNHWEAILYTDYTTLILAGHSPDNMVALESLRALEMDYQYFEENLL